MRRFVGFNKSRFAGAGDPRFKKSNCSLIKVVVIFVVSLVIFWIVFAVYIIPYVHSGSDSTNELNVEQSNAKMEATLAQIGKTQTRTKNLPLHIPKPPPKGSNMHQTQTQDQNPNPNPNHANTMDHKAKVIALGTGPSSSSSSSSSVGSSAYSSAYSDQVCPPKYPKKIPGINEYTYICSHLKKFDIHGSDKCIPPNDCKQCIPPHSKFMDWSNNEVKQFHAKYAGSQQERRATLAQMITEQELKLNLNANLKPDNGDADGDGDGAPQQQQKKKIGPIILMVINEGYLYLFFNWVCSLDHHNIDDIRMRTLIIVTDPNSVAIIRKAGFPLAFHPEWLGDRILNRIDKKAAASFALGAHRWLISLQIATVNDLLHLGYDVIIQDTDIVWQYSPLAYLDQPQLKSIDVLMTVDGTNEFRGPGNSGFFMVRSNCKTKLLLDSMMSLIGLILVGRSDQILWNMILNEKPFRMIHFQLLSTDYFVSGYQVNLQKKTKRSDLHASHFLVHASWTTDQFDKVEKFYMLDHWYFTPDKCPHLYDYAMLPDLAERKWHIRDKTQPQERKFKALGLFRDSTNGTYAKHE